MYIFKLILRTLIVAAAVATWFWFSSTIVHRPYDWPWWQYVAICLPGVVSFCVIVVAIIYVSRTWRKRQLKSFSVVEATLLRMVGNTSDLLSYNKIDGECRLSVEELRWLAGTVLVASVDTEVQAYNYETMRMEGRRATTTYFVYTTFGLISRHVGMMVITFDDENKSNTVILELEKPKLNRTERSLSKRMEPTQDELAQQILARFKPEPTRDR